VPSTEFFNYEIYILTISPGARPLFDHAHLL